MSDPNSKDFALTAVSETGEAKKKPAVSRVQDGIDNAHDEMNSAVVHKFSDSDSPEEKAKKVISQSNSLLAAKSETLQTVPFTPALPIVSPPIAPTETPGMKEADAAIISKQDLSPEELEELEEEANQIPGGLSDTTVAPREIPAWFKIGWSGQQPEDPFASATDVRDRSLLADFVSDSYYGQWYHNSGIIIFAVVSSHFATLFGGGVMALIVILAITTTFYQTSMKRTRRNARDDMAREVAKVGLKTDVESATWLNLFMTRFWIIYEPVLSATIVASVDQVLSVSTPAFLNSIRMTTFTLGTKPPHIDHVRTFPDTDEDIVIMEWKISFTPNDIQDMTTRQALKKVNPKIVLTIKIGVGPAVVGKDIIVEDLAFTGTMRIKIKLMNNFPHVQLVDMSFMGPPVFDFVLKPVGFDLSIIPGLTPFITSQLHATLGPVMYDPAVLTINLEQMLSGAPLDTACGVLVITVHSGRGLKGTKLGSGTPDPYVSLSIAERAELAKTSIKKSTINPNWKETKYILLNNLNEVLSLTVKDFNEHRKDSVIGIANFDLKTLLEDGQQENITAPVTGDGKLRGELKFDAVYYPVLKPAKLADGTDDIIPETRTGVIRLVVHQAKDLDPRDKQLDPFFKVELNSLVLHRSPTLKRTPSPIWERPVEFLVQDKASAMITVHIYDDNLTSDTSMGFVKVKVMDLLAANAKQEDWFPLSNAKSGRLRLTAEWKPVLMIGSINGAGSYTAPIGVIRIWFKRAKDLKNVEALTGGKSDPYVRILRSGIVVGRTLVVNNNCNPEWDEIVYIQVHSPKDTFTFDVMDYQEITKDRSLGTAEFSVAELIKEGEDKKLSPWLSTGKFDRMKGLQSDGKKTMKGQVEFEVEFIPATHLKNVSFDEIPIDKIVEVVEEEEESPIVNGSSSTISEITTSTNGTSVEKESINGVNGSPKIVDSVKEAAAAAKAKAELSEGIVIPRTELLKTQTGIIAFQILSGELSRKGPRLEVAFNQGYWPSYTTEKARSTHCKWDEIGEAMITELEFAEITLKLNNSEKDTRDDIVSSYNAKLVDFLEICLDKPSTFTLTDSNGTNKSTVKICCKYIPVPMELDPRESINNSGNVKIELMDGKDLPSADRSGKSDPFALFELNGVKVHKSEVVKKTLSPVWNERFDIEVSSRVGAKFFVTVFDWDRVGADTPLGRGQIDLSTIEPFEQTEIVVPLSDSKTNITKGSIRIKVVFKPGFFVRPRGATSTFSNVGRIGTGIGSGALGVVGGVGAVAGGVGSIGKGVGRGIGGIGKGLLGRKSTSSIDSVPSSLRNELNGGYDLPPVPSLPSHLIDSPSSGKSLPSISQAGTLSITVNSLIGAEEPDEKKSISIRGYGKEIGITHHQKGETSIFDETFHVKTIPGALELDFSVIHKKTFGASKVLGTSIVHVWDHLSLELGAGVRSTVLNEGLSGGSGKLQITLEWSPEIEDDRQSIAGSFATGKSKRMSRFSIGRNRDNSNNSSD